MADTHPPKLQRRTSDTASQNTSPLGPRGDVWFEDGKVILLANDGTTFASSGASWSKTQEVFCDMFSLPQPEDAEASEGCPIVRLSDTKADPKYFLEALFYSHNHRAPSFRFVSAMLRFGSKYQVEHLRRGALKRFETIFPRSLGDF
ncbi:hypothetical protein BXZ70DRAFT_1007183 [Cristinia sonorae]|uniref:BTB domain-containing protein n=1 Tax=Cristinia sonorae TaxID=1940300 RepID=A0A8K0XQY0_9AGAR|nr:hypothetical protein BXZ70DRAFT_1007183 [Cristinia sonorae]